jgi:hypothetical protein
MLKVKWTVLIQIHQLVLKQIHLKKVSFVLIAILNTITLTDYLCIHFGGLTAFSWQQRNSVCAILIPPYY